MFRRLFWMILGAGIALYSRSKVLRTVEKYIPAPMVRATKRMVSGLVDEYKVTRAEKKLASLQRETNS